MPTKKIVEKQSKKSSIKLRSDKYVVNPNMENPNNLIEVRNVKKSYKSNEVLKGISFDIKKGERVAIIGSNGAGKSTLIESICHIRPFESGTVNFSFGNKKIDLAKRIGIQFQESYYPMVLKMKDILNFMIDIYPKGRSIDKAYLNKLIKLLNLKDILKMQAMQTSGGQRQRFNVLLALVNKPDILFLDELSTGLDIQAKVEIKKYIKDYVNQTNSTLILISHNLDEIEELTDRILVLYNGKIFEDSKITEIKKKHKSLRGYNNYLFDDVFVKLDKKKKELEDKKIKLEEQTRLDYKNGKSFKYSKKEKEDTKDKVKSSPKKKDKIKEVIKK